MSDYKANTKPLKSEDEFDKDPEQYFSANDFFEDDSKHSDYEQIDGNENQMTITLGDTVGECSKFPQKQKLPKTGFKKSCSSNKSSKSKDARRSEKIQKAGYKHISQHISSSSHEECSPQRECQAARERERACRISKSLHRKKGEGLLTLELQTQTKISQKISGGETVDFNENLLLSKEYDEEQDKGGNFKGSFKKSQNKRMPTFRTPRKLKNITEEDLKKVAMNVSVKIKHPDGTTCHQCRKKTLDLKTICRLSECRGTRGQFCGVCLRNRYGESAKEALLNPKWSCPPCRGMCNCSICRSKIGLSPTGILYPKCKSEGFKSVHECLQSTEDSEDSD